MLVKAKEEAGNQYSAFSGQPRTKDNRKSGRRMRSPKPSTLCHFRGENHANEQPSAPAGKAISRQQAAKNRLAGRAFGKSDLIGRDGISHADLIALDEISHGDLIANDEISHRDLIPSDET